MPLSKLQKGKLRIPWNIQLFELTKYSETMMFVDKFRERTLSSLYQLFQARTVVACFFRTQNGSADLVSAKIWGEDHFIHRQEHFRLGTDGLA